MVTKRKLRSRGKNGGVGGPGGGITILKFENGTVHFLFRHSPIISLLLNKEASVLLDPRLKGVIKSRNFYTGRLHA
jgi:hypothetical protein